MLHLYYGTLIYRLNHRNMIESFCYQAPSESAAMGFAILSIGKEYPSSKGWSLTSSSIFPIPDTLVLDTAQQVVWRDESKGNQSSGEA